MSLINQMLRDLEARRRTEGQQPGDEPAPVVTVTSASRRHQLLLFSGVLLAFVIWGGSAFLQQQKKDGKAVMTPVVSAPQPLIKKTRSEAPAAGTALAPIPAAIVVAQAKPEPAAAETAANEKKVIAAAAEAKIAPAEKTVEAAPAQKETGALVDTLPVAVAEARFEKTVAPPSPEQQAQNYYLQALEMQKQGDVAAAENRLIQALKINPQLLDARLQLISLLRQNNRTVEAFSQVEAGLQLYPQSAALRKHKARRLLAAGRLDDAIAILSTEPLPPLADDLEYHALLAALLQERGKYQQAVVAYRHLLSYRPRESMWWLGLAVSLDQNGEAEQAKEAYRKVAGLAGLQADLAEYVESRLQAL